MKSNKKKGDKDGDDNKKDGGTKNYIFRDGKLIEQALKDAKEIPEIAKAIAAREPFLTLVDNMMKAVGKCLESNQGKMADEDVLKLPIGALAYMVGHYYIYLAKVSTISERDKFLKDFSEQVIAAIEMFDMNKE